MRSINGMGVPPWFGQVFFLIQSVLTLLWWLSKRTGISFRYLMLHRYFRAIQNWIFSNRKMHFLAPHDYPWTFSIMTMSLHMPCQSLSSDMVWSYLIPVRTTNLHRPQRLSDRNQIMLFHIIASGRVLIKIRKWKKNRQYNGQKKRTNEQTMIYKTLHRKVKIEQRKPHKKQGWTQVLVKSKQFLFH